MTDLDAERARVRQALMDDHGLSEEEALLRYPDPCSHEAWEEHGTTRTCTDCGHPLEQRALHQELAEGIEAGFKVLDEQNLRDEQALDGSLAMHARDNERCQCGHKRKHHTPQYPDFTITACAKCFDKGALVFGHYFTKTAIPSIFEPRLPQGTALAVVYTIGEHTVEMMLPPGASVAHLSGGILVQHEDAEARIVSVRQLIQGEARAAEDHE